VILASEDPSIRRDEMAASTTFSSLHSPDPGPVDGSRFAARQRPLPRAGRIPGCPRARRTLLRSRTPPP
jgi:hypothetical protein